MAPALPLSRCLFLGLATGVLSGLFGVGGGIVLVPGLVLLLGFGQHAAHATSLAAILLTASAGLARFAVEGAVSYGPGAAIAAGALAGAFAGAAGMRRLSEARLRQVFAVVVVVVAARLLLDSGAGAPVHEAGLGAAQVFAFVLLGVATGLLSALLGVGGGVIMVPALVLLFGFSQHTAEGTSLLVIIPTALTGALRHGGSGFTNWRAGAVIGAGGLAGGLLGAHLALMLAGPVLQRAFALFILVIGARMLLPARRRAGS